MAITAIKNPSSLRMVFYCGKDDNQKNIMRSKTYSKVKPAATNEKVYAVATGLAGLQKNNLVDIIKQDYTVIAE